MKNRKIDKIIKERLKERRVEELRIAVINGATREDGNTDVIVENFTDGLKTGGCAVYSILLRELQYSDCIGCCTCKKETKCNFSDDLTDIRELIMKSDVLVFASPLYFCGVTGLMKTFLDRLYFFYHPENKHLVSGKKAVVLTVLGEKEVGYETAVLEEFYRRYFHALEIRLVDTVFFTDLMGKGEILERADYLEKAYYAGRGLPLRLKKRKKRKKTRSFS